MSLKVSVLVSATALMLALPAFAQTMVTGADEAEILKAAKAIGTASMGEPASEGPVINGVVDGLTYQIYFRNCAGDSGCEDLNFYAGFLSKPDLGTINTWNRDKRFSRAYLDAEGDAVIEMDLDLVQGVTPEYLASQFALWPQIIRQFTDHIGY